MQALESARRDKENAEAQLSMANARAQHAQSGGNASAALADAQVRPRTSPRAAGGAQLAARTAGGRFGGASRG